MLSNYNHAYRGPISYDKHVLNTLELQNNAKRLKKTIEEDKTDNAFIQMKNKFEDLYSSTTSNSLSEELFVVQLYLK